MFTAVQYSSSYYMIWNQFVETSKCVPFLFHRDYMEYHKARFEDFSLMLFEDQLLVAILPGNRVGDTLYSHQGLTYGGFYFSSKFTVEKIEIIIQKSFVFLQKHGIKQLVLKQIPSIYLKGNQGIDYILFNRYKSFLFKREMSLIIDYKEELLISKSKLKHFNKIDKLGLKIQEESNLTSFWTEVLEPRLLERYKTKPVHSLLEIQKLKNQFPSNIRQYSVYFENKIIAGVTLFISKKGIKSQYGATTILGEKYRALDFLFIKLIQKFKDSFHFFDMGTVSNDSFLGYNVGLLQQKVELGCSIYNLDTYTIEIENK
ncbi:FemAB family protein [Flavobacterium columnare]|uniref:FemAB family protein n=1 Tax=Flavobacterium columnare TaxID=996 RepID=A0AAI8GAQ6_9FLAO|nr:FemAB family protein [Flavobacterium columnare]AMO19669.1 FemAB family protein [Flavobacterium columnare]QOG56657.1 FemAB family protein [Flavobacterium columnare]QOG59382.1 FemAB family protein [Flavobacterium columnare]QOG62102.1 FemAB family protein [Flavobacterium columnare]QOG64825.1 FemAB family protein [Flavobacterium columnare]